MIILTWQDVCGPNGKLELFHYLGGRAISRKRPEGFVNYAGNALTPLPIGNILM